MTTQGHFVCPGGPADGRLVPGDQLVKINNVAVDDLTPEQAAEIIRSTQTAALTNTHISTSIGTNTRKKCLELSYVHHVNMTSLATLSSLFRECQETLTMTVLRSMLVSLLHLTNNTQTHTFHRNTHFHTGIHLIG